MTTTQDSTKDMLIKQVQSIIETIESEPDYDDDESLNAGSYLEDILDIEYIISAQREYLGARILVCFGGPNVWINTRTEQVEGYWWGESYFESFTDNLGLDDYMSELWACQ